MSFDRGDLAQTDSCAPPGIKKQFLISRFYKRAWPNRSTSGIGVPVPSNVTLKSLPALACALTVAPKRRTNPAINANALDMIATFRW